MTSTLRAGLIGAGIGGASMFLLDPDRGARRRALLRDRAVRTARKTRDEAVDDATIQTEIRAHATADGNSALQGGSTRPDRWMTWARESWSPIAVLLVGAGIATGAVLIAAARARTNGDASADADAREARTAPPSPEQEAAEAFETEIGILIVGAAPTEPGTFATDELSS